MEVTTNAQVAVIVQMPNSAFTTANDGTEGDGEYVYRTTSSVTADTREVTFTNTRKEDTLELHVAVVQGSAINKADGDYRTTTESGYTLAVALSTNGTFEVDAEDLSAKADTILKTEIDGAYLGVYYGNTNGEGKVTLVGQLTSVGFVKADGAQYYDLYLNGDTSLKADNYEFYYLYCEMPKVYYVKEGANGAITQVDPITINGSAVTLNDVTVAQGGTLEVASDGTVTKINPLGQNVYRVPLVLDGTKHSSMNQGGYALGKAGATSTSGADGVVSGDSLNVKLDTDGFIKWSEDGETWHGFSGAPAIYVLYKEIGYDLTINMKSLASDADKATDKFTLTLSSDNLDEVVSYTVSGYSTDTVTPANGAITLTAVTNGSSITIMSLPDNSLRYTLVETLPEGYVLTNVTYSSGESIEAAVENGTAFYLTQAEKVELTNIKSYDVSFLAVDGETELGAARYPYGTPASKVVAPEAPAKPMDENYLYRFSQWKPTVESVASNTVYTAAYRAIALPHATQRAADTNLTVVLTEEALMATLESLGIDILADDYDDEVASARLNESDPNGLRRWENLVTGTPTNQPLLSTSISSDSTTLTISLAADPLDAMYLGYEVLHALDKKGSGSWNRVAGPVSDKKGTVTNPSLSVRLLDDDGNSVGASGLYRIVTLLVPESNLAITNEIPSTNIVGVLEVVSSSTNTMVAVPWKALASLPIGADDVKIGDLAVPSVLKSGDRIYDFNASTKVYDSWAVGAKANWDEVATVAAEDTKSTVSTPKAANVHSKARGGGFWLYRSNPLGADGKVKPFFLVGQFDPGDVSTEVAGGTADEPGYTMMGCPGNKSIKINDIDWGDNPTANDVISIPKDNGVPLALTWKNGAWGYSKTSYNAKKHRIESVRVTDVEIPAGRSFWYARRGEAFTVKWKISWSD